jgi:DNA processing protein
MVRRPLNETEKRDWLCLSRTKNVGPIIFRQLLRRFGSAHAALNQGREVFAVPGSPLDPCATGTNDLIRQGAVLTEKAADVLNHIHRVPRLLAEPPAKDFLGSSTPLDENVLTRARAEILDNLSPSPVSVDELARQCHLSPSVVLTVLLELELAGLVERQVGNKVVLIGTSCLTSSLS